MMAVNGLRPKYSRYGRRFFGSQSAAVAVSKAFDVCCISLNFLQ